VCTLSDKSLKAAATIQKEGSDGELEEMVAQLTMNDTIAAKSQVGKEDDIEGKYQEDSLQSVNPILRGLNFY